MSYKTVKLCLICYLISGVLSFGHYYNTTSDTTFVAGHSMKRSSLDKATAGFFVSIFNPLYWSSVFFENKE